jgi:hypothetical protein
VPVPPDDPMRLAATECPAFGFEPSGIAADIFW